MARILEMPKLSPTMEEGVLSAWHKNEGDEVGIDNLLADVETDKATMEFRSFDKGTLLKLLVPAGAQVRLGQPVAILGSASEDISELTAKAGLASAPQGKQAPTASAGQAPVQVTPTSPARPPATVADSQGGPTDTRVAETIAPPAQRRPPSSTCSTAPRTRANGGPARRQSGTGTSALRKARESWLLRTSARWPERGASISRERKARDPAAASCQRISSRFARRVLRHRSQRCCQSALPSRRQSLPVVTKRPRRDRCRQCARRSHDG